MGKSVCFDVDCCACALTALCLIRGYFAYSQPDGSVWYMANMLHPEEKGYSHTFEFRQLGPCSHREG